MPSEHGAQVTPERAQELIDRLTDGDLIDFATTCSNKAVALEAEMQLRKRYPSSIVIENPK